VHAHGRHREQLRADVDQPEEHRLPLLQLRPEARHRVEQRAAQLARRPLDITQMLGKRAVAGEARPAPPTRDQARHPAGEVRTEAGYALHLVTQLGIGVYHAARTLQVRVHRLARDEEAHDLTRALEDHVDPQVAHHTLERNALLATRLQRGSSLVAATATNLHRLVDDMPRRLRVEHLRERSLETDVTLAGVRKP